MLYPLNSPTRGPKSLGLKGKLLTICVPQKINNAREVRKKVIHYLVLALFLSTARAWHATSLRSLENTKIGARKNDYRPSPTLVITVFWDLSDP